MGKLAIFAVAMLFFQVAGEPIVIGKHRAALTGDELAAISTLVGGRGASVWIVDVWPVADTLTATVYRKPDRTAPEIRRGRLVTVTRGYAAPDRSPRPWVVVESGPGQLVEYAQVPIAGREVDDVRDEVDDNRPFSVVGEIGDADLIGIVGYVRGVKLGRGPITSIARWDVWPRASRADGATVSVKTRQHPECFESYEVRRSGESWSWTGDSGFGCP